MKYNNIQKIIKTNQLWIKYVSENFIFFKKMDHSNCKWECKMLHEVVYATYDYNFKKIHLCSNIIFERTQVNALLVITCITFSMTIF